MKLIILSTVSLLLIIILLVIETKTTEKKLKTFKEAFVVASDDTSSVKPEINMMNNGTSTVSSEICSDESIEILKNLHNDNQIEGINNLVGQINSGFKHINDNVSLYYQIIV